jgi:hypothetical protein
VLGAENSMTEISIVGLAGTQYLDKTDGMGCAAHSPRVLLPRVGALRVTASSHGLPKAWALDWLESNCYKNLRPDLTVAHRVAGGSRAPGRHRLTDSAGNVQASSAAQAH